MNNHRDYLPAKERNLQERREGSGSLEEGLSSRVEATRHKPPYRTFLDKDGRDEREKRMEELFGPMGIDFF